MSSDIALCGAQYALHAERAPGAPEATYFGECLTCRAESGLIAYDPKPVSVWCIEHTRYFGLDHGQFLVTTQRHWRVGPLPPRPATPPPEPITEAPPSWWRRWLGRSGWGGGVGSAR